MEHVSCSSDGMVEYWNVDLNKEVTHLLTSLLRRILPILHLVQDKFTHRSIFPEPIISSFQYSNCERSELSSYLYPGVGMTGRHVEEGGLFIRVSAKVSYPDKV